MILIHSLLQIQSLPLRDAVAFLLRIMVGDVDVDDSVLFLS
jgi:hypothetical protein